MAGGDADSTSYKLAYSHDDIEIIHAEAVVDGYEGVVIYNKEGLYQYNTRSSNVFKYKIAFDAEYKIAGYLIDKNKQPVFICKTSNGKLFNVKPTGTASERQAILDNITYYVGKWYKVAYEQLSIDLIPLKPRGIGLRNCDVNGEPKE